MPKNNKISEMKAVLVVVIFFLIIGIGILIVKTQNPSDFEQIDYYKVDKPPVRALTYYTSSKDSLKIRRHAQAQPWDTNGVLQVFYFDDRDHTPEVKNLSFDYNKEYEKHCVAIYRKLTK